jgi:hypothetical protein
MVIEKLTYNRVEGFVVGGNNAPVEIGIIARSHDEKQKQMSELARKPLDLQILLSRLLPIFKGSSQGAVWPIAIKQAGSPMNVQEFKFTFTPIEWHTCQAVIIGIVQELRSVASVPMLYIHDTFPDAVTIVKGDHHVRLFRHLGKNNQGRCLTLYPPETMPFVMSFEKLREAVKCMRTQGLGPKKKVW